jgi:hypothetical protein
VPVADDLDYVNSAPATSVQQLAGLSRDESDHIEKRVRRVIRVRDEFVNVPFPRLVATSNAQVAAAVENYKREAAIVDTRLSREVTLAIKATALSDLCDQLRKDTGIRLEAGSSVADEKVTVFCEKMPLRDVMRQLGRPFGYTWLRSGKEGEYHYELVQDLRSQLLEEELRNRDRNAALLALDREMERYRKYLGLTPDEALARSRTAPPEEKKLLERFAADGWGLIQMYFRLAPGDVAALRAGHRLTFTQQARPDEQPLPAELARGVIQSQRNRRLFISEGRFQLGNAKSHPEGLLPEAVPEARAMLMLRMPQSELGQFTLTGGPGLFISAGSPTPGGFHLFGSAGDLAVGVSPAVLTPNNAAANARLARDPGLRRRVTLQPKPSCEGSRRRTPDSSHPEPIGTGPGDAGRQPSALCEKVTTADVLEALHRATGRPIVADFYTRLFVPRDVSVADRPLFEALNQIGDTVRLRWDKDGDWLRFRSTSFFNDRLKEVPNRLLARWSAARRQLGGLTLDDVIEIAQFSDAQLDATSVAEGARSCWGLAEWDLVHSPPYLRSELRYLAGFTPAQRQQIQSPAGLAFTKMTLAQQQGYLARALRREVEVRLEELGGSTLRVDYTRPGEFQWVQPGWRKYLPSPVRERTPEAALQAARRIDPAVTESQIVPTRLEMTVLYTPSASNVRQFRVVRTDSEGWVP